MTDDVEHGRYFQAHALRLEELGWGGIIPLKSKEKAPNLRGWQSLTRRLDEDAPRVVVNAKRQLHLPGPLNVGQTTGHAITWVDVDTVDPAVADVVRSFKPSIVKVGSRGLAAAFRSTEINGLLDPLVPGVALYGGGPGGRPGLTAIYGVHPKTGRPYSYDGPGPLDMDCRKVAKMPNVATLKAALLEVPSVEEAFKARASTTIGGLDGRHRPSAIVERIMDSDGDAEEWRETLVGMVLEAHEGDRFQSFLDTMWAAVRLAAYAGLFEGDEGASTWLAETRKRLEDANVQVHGGDTSFTRGDPLARFYGRHYELALNNVRKRAEGGSNG